MGYPMRIFPALGLLLATAALSSTATATIQQPNGTIMPRDAQNGEVQLYTFFADRGETIDYQADAHATPATFSPACDFRVTLMLRQSQSRFAFGWYNASATGLPPEAGDLHTLLPSDAPVGTQVTAAKIRDDPAWQGGLIGFAYLTPQVFYTEKQHNRVCTGCTPPAPWILSAIYASTVTTNAYYVAFEDGSVGGEPNAFNNDGDFNDAVLFVEGAFCPGAGRYCDTGAPGICAPGLTTCKPTGTACAARSTSTDEVCNGLDDDCNGLVDDGTALCPTSQVCDHGTCVASCTATSCPAGKACSARGTCVEAACATTTCAPGQVCTAGSCREACSNVACPTGQICQGDRCVDPCAGVTCASNEVCDRGVCRRRCDCLPCEPGLACNATSGACVEAACASVTCAAGSVCRAGACVDACTDVKCPPDQVCTAGQCVAPSAADAGADAGRGDAGSPADASAPPSPNAGDAGDENLAAPIDDTGCSCGTPGRSGSYGPAGAAAALAAVAILARRRRRTRALQR